MRKSSIAAICCLLVYSLQAQQTIDNNMKRCASTEATTIYFAKHPEQKKKFDDYQLSFNQKVVNLSNYKTSSTPNYTIPVVFHILHLGGSENISDAQIEDQMRILNLDFSKRNADTSLTLPVFKSIADSTPIRFALAKIDPNGNCTNGIIHYYNSDANWEDSSPTLYSQGWDPTKYMNVYVVKSITLGSGFNAAGYTYLPGTWNIGDASDAIVVLHNYIGTIGTSSLGHSHVLTHEVGHWLNLNHVFGWNSCGDNCFNDDYVYDTPQTAGYVYCPTPSGSQNCTPGVTENYQNFMDYSYCETMFTHGQSLRMDAAAHDFIVGRDNLWSNSNLIATGINTPNYSCNPVADFYSIKTTICSGSSITYTNAGSFGSSGSLAWTFEGGIPATSSASLVTVNYPIPGTYSLSLKATNSNGVSVLNKIAYIHVIDGWSGNVAPFIHSFEDGYLPYQSHVINGNLGSTSWANTSLTGADGTSKSLYLNNASSSNEGQLDIFETPVYNLSATTNLNLSYWYAYAKKAVNQADTFKLQYSLDCGGKWQDVIGYLPTSTMATNSGGVTSSPFVPTSSQWKQKTIVSALLFQLNNKPSVKLRFYFRAGAGGANNIYFDEINLSGTVGINELERAVGLNLFPNPANEFLEINFETNTSAIVEIINTLGQVVATPTSFSNHTTLNIAHLARGVYIVNIDIEHQRIAKKLIID